ncbi:MAG: UPF0149 family protein, partial [Leucothrix sp.]
MLIFNCTKAAQDFFTITRKGKKQTIVETPPCKEMSEDSLHLTSQSEKPLRIQQWMLHAVSIKRKHCLVAVEVNTRFCVVLAGLKKADLEGFLSLFKTYFSSQVLGYGNEVGIWNGKDSKKIVKETLNHFAETHFFRRYDSSVQARINGIVQELRHWADVEPTLLTDENTLLNFSYRSNTRLWKSKAYPKQDYIVPNEEMLIGWQQLYQKATPKQLTANRKIMREYEQKRMAAFREHLQGGSLLSGLPEQPLTDESGLIMPSSEALSDDDLEFLDDMLSKYETEFSLQNASSLHGFLTAVISGPNMMPPSHWLPQIWGEKQPNWEGMDELQRFMGAVFTMMNNISATLMDAPQDFVAIFIGDQDNAIVNYWCAGYLSATDMDEEAWANLPDHLAEKMSFLDEVALKLTVDGGKPLLVQKPLCDEIVSIAQALHAYWLTQRSPVPRGMQSKSNTKRPDNVIQLKPQHPVTGQKTGRNEPCPCGSGK